MIRICELFRRSMLNISATIRLFLVIFLHACASWLQLTVFSINVTNRSRKHLSEFPINFLRNCQTRQIDPFWKFEQEWTLLFSGGYPRKNNPPHWVPKFAPIQKSQGSGPTRRCPSRPRTGSPRSLPRPSLTSTPRPTSTAVSRSFLRRGYYKMEHLNDPLFQQVSKFFWKTCAEC